MKEQINQITRGIIEYKKPHIAFSCNKLEEIIPKGYIHNYEFTIQSENQIAIDASIYSSHPDVTVKQNEITSSTVARVLVEVNALYAEKADEINGDFYFVSNGGEYRLPYHFTVEDLKTEKINKEINSEKAFAELAKQNFEEALRIFESEIFIQLDFMKDDKKRALYFNLLGGENDRKALEEFLIGAGMKKSITISVKTQDAYFKDSDDEKQINETVELYADGWGYLAITCAADVPWIKIKKRRIYLEDFEYNTAFYEYSIDHEKLHAGKNFGTISFTTPGRTLYYHIQADFPASKKHHVKPGKKEWFEIYKRYIDYQSHQGVDEVILEEMERQATQMMKKYPDDYQIHLLRAWIYISQKKENMAEKVIEWIESSIKENKKAYPDEYVVMLYLKALLSENEQDILDARTSIHAFYSMSSSIAMTILELYVSPAYNQPKEAYIFLKAQFERGKRSPFLYSLASQILRQDPSILTELKLFELLVLYYSAKNDLINEELAHQILHLSAVDVKHFLISYRLLCKLYKKFPGRPTLTAICSLLVKKGKTGEKYLKWYTLGVEQNIGLTSLYEYYLYSLPEKFDKTIPLVIIRAYAGKDDLDERSRYILYTYVIQKMKKDTEYYALYQDRMRKFAVMQLEKGIYSEKMYPLYHEFFYADMVDDRLARKLPDLLFTKKITTNLKFVTRAVLQYANLREEIARPVENMTTFIPIYSDSAALIFEDECGNRYVDPDYKKEDAYMDEELLKRSCELCPKHLMLRLLETGKFAQDGIYTEEQLNIVLGLIEEAQIEPSYRRSLISAIIDYCSKNNLKTEESDSFLFGLDEVALSREDRKKVIEILIRNAYYKKAYEKIAVFGYWNISKKRLLKLITKCIEQSRNGYDRLSIDICSFLCQAEFFNEVTLGFLMKYFKGNNEQMYAFLVKAKQLNVDCREFPGRLLEQMFVTGEYMHMVQVYNWYIQKDNNISEVIQKAYYVLKCHCYFCGENWDNGNLRTLYPVDIILLEEWVRTERNNCKLPVIYGYTLLQYYSLSEHLDSDQKKLAKELIAVFNRKGIWLKSMVDLKKHIELPIQIEGRNVAEIRKKADKVRISTLRFPEEEMEYGEMNQVWPGVFTKSFLLFEDEVLYCYISDEKNTSEKKEELRILGKECYRLENSKYTKLNEAITMLKDKKYMNLKEQLKEMETAEEKTQILLPLL